jgi:hypothetical protein
LSLRVVQQLRQQHQDLGVTVRRVSTLDRRGLSSAPGHAHANTRALKPFKGPKLAALSYSIKSGVKARKKQGKQGKEGKEGGKGWTRKETRGAGQQ